ncbi:chromosome segregation protein SMC [bacterium]|nr:chromosome segregation protein SMC [bacterium]MBU1638244.1 chromosome segregation protein SMC [bacterium]
MQLTSLSISGFKSFAIDTKIDFAEGITAVVGPNGCGKSNVVDSLRWVLGEQRSSVLRGERMENVIFNGTNHRKPLNLAEVRVVVNNESGRINLPYSEIEIARRLHRDGTSEYLLNGNACRLRDITDLLNDSGMGPNMYSILELKMVESILREEGEGRRQLFEEASGITQYKQRRRQALSKLEQTEGDLMRLADILHEVERQVASLKRQVSRARRYKEYSQNLRSMESALMYHEYERLANELKPLEAAMRESSDSTESLKSALRAEDAKLEELKRELIESEQNASEYRRLLEEVVSKISTLEAEQAGHRATVQACHETIERTDRQRILSAEKLDTLNRRMQEQKLQQEATAGELEAADQLLSDAQKNYSGEQNTLQEQERKAVAHENAMQSTRVQLASAQSRHTDALAQQASNKGRKETAEYLIENISVERDRMAVELEELKSEQKSASLIEADLQKNHRSISEQLENSLLKKQELTEEIKLLNSLEQTTRSKLDLLSTLEEKGPRSSESLKSLRNSSIQGLRGLLGDSINVEDKYRRAFQGVLGSAAYHYLTDSIETTFKAIEKLRLDESGRATLITLRDAETADRSEYELPANALCRAIDLIPASDLNSAHYAYLGRTVIVESWEDALALRGWCTETRSTVVTLEGEWIQSDGIFYAGSAEQQRPVDLGLTAQRDELQRLIEQNAKKRAGIIASLGECSERIRTQNDLLKESSSKLQASTEEIRKLRENEVRIITLISSLKTREEDAALRIQACDSQLALIDDSIRETESGIRALKEHLAEQESQYEVISEQLSFARNDLNAARDRLHQTEKSRDTIHHRMVLVDADIERIQLSLTELRETQETNERAAEKAVNDIVRIESRLKEIETQLSDGFQLRDDRLRNVDASTQLLNDIRSRITAREDTLRKLRSGQEDALQGERKLSMDVARLQGEMEALLTNARNQYNLNPSAQDFLETHPELIDIETSPELVQELKGRIDNLGPVNLLAVEEYEQENARLESMLKNREDLLQAKATLEETIRKINETAEAKFLHTFEAVRSNFQTLFLEFFPAGEADLILSGKDLLEADITIWANPSGKRLKSLSLMSGGEKTMTAIALLFSLYRVKPSPFCVLDEVDAPLDDTNIDRFTRMLRHHATETQFILITHNKRTMEIADNLYGVTMQEEGVSKLVSVRLLRDKEPAETT